MSTAQPHAAYPAAPGARGDELFYDAFDAAEGAVATGLFRWQRNQTHYNSPQPWNTTFVDKWPGCARPCSSGTQPNRRLIEYGAAHSARVLNTRGVSSFHDF